MSETTAGSEQAHIEAYDKASEFPGAYTSDEKEETKIPEVIVKIKTEENGKTIWKDLPEEKLPVIKNIKNKKNK